MRQQSQSLHFKSADKPVTAALCIGPYEQNNSAVGKSCTILLP